MRRTLDDLPDTFEETHTHVGREIGNQNWDCAHCLFQCLAVASRPLRVKELVEYPAFNFRAGSTPTLLANWRPEGQENAFRFG
jgi:hypothetical protein